MDTPDEKNWVVLDPIEKDWEQAWLQCPGNLTFEEFKDIVVKKEAENNPSFFRKTVSTIHTGYNTVWYGSVLWQMSSYQPLILYMLSKL